ncbi:MAG TPA: DUF742 domain-containing protein [Rugosimonospora sp.]|nr:DUF742 domain-containing protein [Rugosimonospora sp.]
MPAHEHQPRHGDPEYGENLWLDDEAGPVVRPYAMTSGRTRPSSGVFDLISLVVATRAVAPTDVGLGPEHHTIILLCQRPLSVAEIAAHLDLPVGIVRVLLGDLLERELILVRAPQPASEMPSERIFKAVINGLRAL